MSLPNASSFGQRHGARAVPFRYPTPPGRTEAAVILQQSSILIVYIRRTHAAAAATAAHREEKTKKKGRSRIYVHLCTHTRIDPIERELNEPTLALLFTFNGRRPASLKPSDLPPLAAPLHPSFPPTALYPLAHYNCNNSARSHRCNHLSLSLSLSVRPKATSLRELPPRIRAHMRSSPAAPTAVVAL